ncbi:hemerythrin domain-containing protein [Mycobacterium sp. RTGN5]|uniref:hemerythrin domain-containing protein n=1 Tax=Mycobacterium sp. RTGN5 TaxID=3016522 RepID=UPI0029C8A323|nr:hemerythrin domain-containing protein [Mycobacterium sp. RTGN5]
MTSTVAFDMPMVHRAFRNELHNIPALISAVCDGDAKRATVVDVHLDFIVTVLHHHHAAEDDLIWPKLHARVPMHDADITRMEDEHRNIDAGVAAAQAASARWAKAADSESAEQLQAAVADLVGLVDLHLDDEERDVVPLIEEYVTPAEWAKAIARGAAILRTHPILGLAFAGFLLEGVSAHDRDRFLAGVPAPARVLWQLVGRRTYENYRAKLYGPRPLQPTD